MGLLTWMPCIEDIHNQGLYSSTPSGTFSVDNNGKIGKCLKITSSIDTGLSMAQCNVNQTGVSMGGWFKFNKTEIQAVVNTKTFDSTHPSMYGNIVGYNSYGGIAIVIGTNNIYNDGNFNYIHCFSGIREGNSVYNTSSYIIPFDTWVHIFLVCDRQKLYLYINGALHSSTNNFTPSSVRTDYNFYICRDAIYGGSGPRGYFPMYVNDVRIYDHALSPREVKEISKGLVLHYTLAAPGGENLLKNTNDIVTVNSKSKLYSLSLTPKEFLLQACNKGLTLSYDIHCPGAYPTTTGSLHRLGCYLDCTITNNSTGESKSFYGHHSISGTPTSRHTLNKTNSLNNVSSSSTATNLDLSFNGHYSRTIYPKNFSAVADFYNNPDNYTVTIQGLRSELNGVNVEENTWIKNVKLEFGDKETPWMPNSTDTEYTKMGYNNNIEYDVSGFKNNGTKVGTLTYSSDTPKYWTSTYFTSGTYINAGKGAKVTDAITVNLWVNIKTYGGPISCTEGGGWNFEQSGGYIRFPVYVSSVGYVVAQSPSITVSSLQNNWHMLTGTYDRSNVKLYVDGVLQATVPPSTTGRDIAYNTNNVVFISGEAAGNDTTPAESVYTGSISDVRIYATALSADDILELYHTPVTLTSNGVLMTSGEISET